MGWLGDYFRELAGSPADAAQKTKKFADNAAGYAMGALTIYAIMLAVLVVLIFIVLWVKG